VQSPVEHHAQGWPRFFQLPAFFPALTNCSMLTKSVG
jgi:hypothetical protein